jgi:hypothetical protein
MVSGPGTVAFANPNAASTTATFSAAGVYNLRLTASDGLLTAGDDIVITVDPAPPGSVPASNLRLWLRADTGVTLAAGKVSAWADQSGSGTNAVQSMSANQPTVVANAVNGLPAVEFDGLNDYLTFNLPINDLTGMTIVLVGASTSPTQDGSWHGATHSAIFWNETSDWCATSLTPYSGVVKFRFGTGQSNNLPAWTRPSPIGSEFTVTTAIKNGATEMLFIDGSLVLTAGGKLGVIRGTRPAGNLGRGYNDNTFFAGRIAEVLVYDRALTDAERQILDQYLAGRYGR